MYNENTPTIIDIGLPAVAAATVVTMAVATLSGVKTIVPIVGPAAVVVTAARGTTIAVLTVATATAVTVTAALPAVEGVLQVLIVALITKLVLKSIPREAVAWLLIFCLALLAGNCAGVEIGVAAREAGAAAASIPIRVVVVAAAAGAGITLIVFFVVVVAEEVAKSPLASIGVAFGSLTGALTAGKAIVRAAKEAAPAVSVRVTFETLAFGALAGAAFAAFAAFLAISMKVARSPVISSRLTQIGAALIQIGAALIYVSVFLSDGAELLKATLALAAEPDEIEETARLPLSAVLTAEEADIVTAAEAAKESLFPTLLRERRELFLLTILVKAARKEPLIKAPIILAVIIIMGEVVVATIKTILKLHLIKLSILAEAGVYIVREVPSAELIRTSFGYYALFSLALVATPFAALVALFIALRPNAAVGLGMIAGVGAVAGVLGAGRVAGMRAVAGVGAVALLAPAIVAAALLTPAAVTSAFANFKRAAEGAIASFTVETVETTRVAGTVAARGASVAALVIALIVAVAAFVTGSEVVTVVAVTVLAVVASIGARAALAEVTSPVAEVEAEMEATSLAGAGAVAAAGAIALLSLPAAVVLLTPAAITSLQANWKRAVVPAEIIMQGETAIKIYKEAVQNGVIKDPRYRLLVVGPDRVGKTSLIKLLTGIKFDSNEESTHVIDVVNVKTSSSNEIWIIQPKDRTNCKAYQTEDGTIYSEHEVQMAYEIAQKIKDETQREKIENTEVKKKHLEKPLMETKEEVTIIQKDQEYSSDSNTLQSQGSNNKEIASSVSQPPENNQKMKENKFTEDENSVHSKLKEKGQFKTDFDISERLLKLIEELLDINHPILRKPNVELSIWDFSGQGLYYTCHKVFLSSASIFILAFDLSKNMEETANEWIEDGFTHGQVLEFWLDSIYAYTKSSDPLSVLLVGTHASQATEKQIKEVSDYIQKLLEEKGHLKNFLKGNFKHLFYTIENSCEFEKNDEAKRLQGYIENEIIPTLMEKRDKKPLNWLEFETEIKKIDKNEEKQLATLDEVKEIAVNCKVIRDKSDEERLMVILQFLHDIGSIIYYGKDDKSLSDLVILKPEWLIEVFKKLMIVHKAELLDFNFKESWKKLKEKNILTNSLMDHVLGELQKNKSSVIKLMKNYDMLCEHICGEEIAYYVPFVLVHGEEDIPYLNPRKPDKILDNNTSTTLVIDFHRFLPAGLFHRLVIRMLKWSEDNDCSRTYEREIFNRYLAAPIESKHVVILEWMPQHEIKIIVKRCHSGAREENSLPDSSISIKVLDFVKNSLSELKMFGMRDVKYKFYVDIKYYPQTHLRCRCKPRFELEFCRKLPKGNEEVHCPKHVEVLVNLMDIKNRFTVCNQGVQDKVEAVDYTKGQSDQPIANPELNDDFLWNLGEDLGANWEKVGYKLGMTQKDIQRAKGNHQFDMTKQAHSLLIQWREQTSRKQNKKGLLASALKKAGCTEISEKLGLQDEE